MSTGNLQTWFPAPSQKSGGLRAFLFLFLQLAATFSLAWAYSVESGNGFLILLPLFAVSILIHHWLPSWLRPAWFVLTAWTCLFYALGWISGGLALGGGLAYFVIAHLPVRFAWRILAAIVLTVAFLIVRLQLIYMPHLLVAIPVIASMLMFRFILYMYELAHEKQKASWTERLSYFFNPLNLVFPLFPILDYKTWLRSPYSEDAEKVYARAARRVLLGILQLLLYRWIYLHLPNPAVIQDARELLFFVLGCYATVLRMLGIFWIAVGLLGFFGYNLPPIFDNAFFVQGFGDIWRRINIYWRDFITKIFYYEIYFKLRKKTKKAILFAALLTFVATWLLHGWQWLWLRGDLLMKSTDLLYWMVLGAFIAIALSREDGSPRKKESGRSLARSAVYMLRICGMYLFMSTLWSLWNSSSPGEWIFLLGKAGQNPAGLVIFVPVAILLFAGGALLHYFLEGKKPEQSFSPLFTTVLALAVSGLLILPVSSEGIRTALPDSAQKLLADIEKPRLNQFDRENAEQGYYEMLVDTRGSSPWEQQVQVRGRGQWFSKAEMPVNDLRKRTLYPSIQLRNGQATFTTNRWGMRSPECDTINPRNVIRIAVLGGSYEMGSGVSDEEVFVRRFEKKMNDSLAAAGDSLRVEVLNFSAGAYHIPQAVWLCDHDVSRFHPDLVLYFAHSDEARRLNTVMAGLVKNGLDLHYDFLKKTKEKTGVRQSMSRTEIRNRLLPENEAILQWGLAQMRASQAGSVRFFMVYLPTLNSPGPPGESSRLEKLAEENGFGFLSLEGVYGHHSQDELQVQPNDNHPNAEGHRLIADKLFQNAAAAKLGSR